MPLQHYTTKHGLASILRDGHIDAAHNDFYGAGVYFTALPPSRGRSGVSVNNWCWLVGEERMVGVIKIYKVRTNGGSSRDSDFVSVGDDDGRDVWLYTNSDGIDLDEYHWKAFRITWKKDRLKSLELVRHEVGEGCEDRDYDGHGGDECDSESDADGDADDDAVSEDDEESSSGSGGFVNFANGVPCIYYNKKGGCKHGDDCTYEHVCKFYRDGYCRFGDACSRMHR